VRGTYEGLGSTHIDLDVFIGTVQEMVEWLSMEQEPEYDVC
jgi:hypothetical protein